MNSTWILCIKFIALYLYMCEYTWYIHEANNVSVSYIAKLYNRCTLTANFIHISYVTHLTRFVYTHTYYHSNAFTQSQIKFASCTQPRLMHDSLYLSLSLLWLPVSDVQWLTQAARKQSIKQNLFRYRVSAKEREQYVIVKETASSSQELRKRGGHEKSKLRYALNIRIYLIIIYIYILYFTLLWYNILYSTMNWQKVVGVIYRIIMKSKYARVEVEQVN